MYGEILHANGNQNKARVAILISDKMDIKIKNIIRDKEKGITYVQGINPRRRYKNCKYVCNQHRSPSKHKANTFVEKEEEPGPVHW